MRLGHVAACIPFFLVLLSPNAVAAAGRRPAAGQPEAAAGRSELSDRCGECHRDIYRMWRGSIHARALDDDIFLQAYKETRAREGEAVSRVCLRCHAPMAELTHDWSLERKRTWEGVNCDVCHGLVSVEVTPEGAHQVIAPGEIKRGPIEDAASDAHQVAYSPLHTTSLVCAGCHEYVNSEGVAILSTYSEWKTSRAAAEERQCQACHMGRTRADVVDPRVKRVPDAEVNLHEVPGGHSLDMLQKALSASLDPSRRGDSLVVAVRLANKGAGHAVPTGMPGRRIILELSARGGNGAVFREERVFGRVFASAAGDTIRRDCGYFARGARPVADTRMPADGRWEETFRFPVPARSTASVTLRLIYEHAPTGGEEGRVRTTFLSEERTVNAGS